MQPETLLINIRSNFSRAHFYFRNLFFENQSGFLVKLLLILINRLHIVLCRKVVLFSQWAKSWKVAAMKGLTVYKLLYKHYFGSSPSFISCIKQIYTNLLTYFSAKSSESVQFSDDFSKEWSCSICWISEAKFVTILSE